MDNTKHVNQFSLNDVDLEELLKVQLILLRVMMLLLF